MTGAGRLSGLLIRAPFGTRDAEILTPDALGFLQTLVRHHRGPIRSALSRRGERRHELAAGARLDFLPETRRIREADWRVAPVPACLEHRTVEITGPVARKMIINALNSGADAFMADFEDSNSPTWSNCIEGQVNLRDAVRRTITFHDPVRDRHYALESDTATLFVRPRGLHLFEHHVVLDGRPIPAALFDFGLFFYHNARELVRTGTGPFFYLPKLESHLEARIWSRVFSHAEALAGLPEGTIKATVLIETLPAAFEMNEILWELRRHSAGLNCGRWDYIFSFIKSRREDADAVLPDRSAVDMGQPCMRAYTRLAIQTAHRRGAHAMGGMAAQIPIRDDPAANDEALGRVRADKLREARDGHDGTWVAHPGLVSVARDAFAEAMSGPNQLDVIPPGPVAASDLLRVPTGTRTEEGLRLNVRVGLRYLEAWLMGSGAVPLYGLMEDAATAEISRTQIWQWIRHRALLDDGRPVTTALVREIIDDELARIRHEVGAERFDDGRFATARSLFDRLCCSECFEEFLTNPAYDALERRT
ncbi:MAG: malate synthase A [Gemmatimonadota bacterium]